MRFFLCCLITLPLLLNAQEKTPTDSIIERGVVEDTTHSPRKATLYSLMLPGAGQVYNHLAIPKKGKGKNSIFWKIPLFYAGLGATAYYGLKHHRTQQILKKEYNYRVEYGEPNPELEEYAVYDNQGILTLFQQSQRNRDLMLFAFIAVYGLNVLDAHVNAHFVNFDVSKDLTLNIRPSLQQLNSPGLALTLNFR